MVKSFWLRKTVLVKWMVLNDAPWNPTGSTETSEQEIKPGVSCRFSETSKDLFSSLSPFYTSTPRWSRLRTSVGGVPTGFTGTTQKRWTGWWVSSFSSLLCEHFNACFTVTTAPSPFFSVTFFCLTFKCSPHCPVSHATLSEPLLKFFGG